MNTPDCVFCEAGKPASMGVTEANLAMCRECYGKVLAKGISWEPTATKAELLHALRARVQRVEILNQEVS
jgi:hypothetical protein